MVPPTSRYRWVMRLPSHAQGWLSVEDVSGFNDPLTGNKRRQNSFIQPSGRFASVQRSRSGVANVSHLAAPSHGRCPGISTIGNPVMRRRLAGLKIRDGEITSRLRSEKLNPRGRHCVCGGGLAARICPNCSQTIPRLWALAGQMPPNGVIAPGYQGKRRRGPVGPTTDPVPLYFHHQSSNHLASTSDYGDRQLGTWSRGENGWKRRPQR